jgi:hypothetical protein
MVVSKKNPASAGFCFIYDATSAEAKLSPKVITDCACRTVLGLWPSSHSSTP